MIKHSIFLGDDYLGEALMSCSTSYHYLCRKCGNIWARTISAVEGEHHALTGFCPNCDYMGSFAPAIISYEMRFRTEVWPKTVLVRDFLYLMERNSDLVIDHNLPENLHEQRKTA